MTKLLWSLPIAMAVATVSTPSRAQTAPPAPAPPGAPAAPAAPAPAEVRLDLVNGEVKLLALDESKSWKVEPEGGLLARAVDEGHTLRLVAQKDGLYTVRIERNDGSIALYTVHVGKDASPGPAVAGPPPPPDPNRPPPDRRSADEHYYANTIDLNLEGGGGYHFGKEGEAMGFGRARVGVMLARWPIFSMLGVTYEYSNLAPAAFGLQGELLHLSAGFWAQIGAEIDTHAKAGAMASLGFSVVGVEAQYRGYEKDDGGLVTGFALLGKIRVPLGVILYAVDQNKNHR